MKVSTRVCAQLGLVATFVVLAASVSVLILRPRYSKPLGVADVGTLAPAFELSAINGQRFNLADSRGQVVVLFFSALNDSRITTCYDQLDRLARQYEDDGRVRILGINITRGEHLDPMLFRLEDTVATRSFPTLLDDQANVASRYSATSTPLMVIIDPHGVVRYRGPVDDPASDFPTMRNSFVEEAIRNLAANATLAVAK